MSATARPQWRLTRARARARGRRVWSGGTLVNLYQKRDPQKSEGGESPQPNRKAKEKRRQMRCASVDNISTCGQHGAQSQICKDQRLSALSKLYFKLQPGTIRTSRRGD